MLLLEMRYTNLIEEMEKLRKENLLSVPEMAKEIGLSYVGLRKILKGETSNIQKSTLRSIKLAFDVEIVEDGDKIYFQAKKTVYDSQVKNPEYRAILEEIGELAKNADKQFLKELLEYIHLRKKFNNKP